MSWPSFAYRLTQSHSDSYASANAFYTRSDPLSFFQICPNLLISITQGQPISLRFAVTHSDSCNLAQICSASCKSTQIHSDSQKLENISLSHSDSLKIIQIHSDPFSDTRIHSDSISFAPDSLCLPQTHSDSLRFIQICSD